MSDWTEPYKGGALCDRCPSQGRRRTATRQVWLPAEGQYGHLCQECADVWSGVVNQAVESTVAEVLDDWQLARKVRGR